MLLPAVTLVVSAGLLVPALFAADAFVGTWKVNVAKSTPGPHPPREPRVQKIEAVPDGIRVVEDQVAGGGERLHDEWTVKFDGKPYPTTLLQDGKPDPAVQGETVSATRIDDHTFQFTFTLNGKVILQARNVISGDGKTRTATQTGTSTDGKQRVVTIVFDKQ
jgi:hypothetical protein